MSYDPRRAGRAHAIHDARQNPPYPLRDRPPPDSVRMAGLSQRSGQFVSQNPSRKANQMPLHSVPSNQGEVAGRESPDLQWPLPNTITDAPYSRPVIPSHSAQRMPPPQQFSRPFSGNYPIQRLSPALASRPSPAHAQPSLGNGTPYTNQDLPPPAAPKEAYSYYSQMPHVSPIVEEMDARSVASRSRHGSYASSNVFPTNSDGFYPEDDVYSEDEMDIVKSDQGTVTPDHDDHSGLVKQPPALVRQASLGRRTKPSLMTIKSTDNFTGGGKKKPGEMGIGIGADMNGANEPMQAAREQSPSRLGRSTLGEGRGLIQTSPFSDAANIVEDKEGQSVHLAGSASSPHPLSREMRPTGLTGRVGLRRPLKLDMEAVRDAEARGSMTSLPDLIRRATRLAANLDRGRTASRLGLDFWESGLSEKRDRRQSGLSDMLAAFPPPGQDTPIRTGTPNPGRWPLAGDGTDSRLNPDDETKKRRRCCGMPMGVFVFLLIALLLLIAAAITVPIVFVVIPNQNNHQNNNAAAQDNANIGMSGTHSNGNSKSAAPMVLPGPVSSLSNNHCGGLVTCQNGGIAIPNADQSCNCICINGFTGRTCTDNDANGCTSTTIANTANNATVGSGIPRLVAGANKNFNIPLDATRILSVFSNLSLSCAAENALITFNGLAARSLSHQRSRSTIRTTLAFALLHHQHPADVLGPSAKRDTVDPSGSNKLVTQSVSTNAMALDFARTGVLFALQETSNLDTAAKAQDAIQKSLAGNHGSGSDDNQVELGPFAINLVDFTITFKNGTTIRAPQRGP